MDNENKEGKMSFFVSTSLFCKNFCFFIVTKNYLKLKYSIGVLLTVQKMLSKDSYNMNCQVFGVHQIKKNKENIQ
jgi:hypothetical protein